MPPPIQMCDALSRNMPRLAGVKILLAHCLAHARRQIVDQAENCPEECQYVLDTLGSICPKRRADARTVSVAGRAAEFSPGTQRTATEENERHRT
jgi:hypothetical protein